MARTAGLPVIAGVVAVIVFAGSMIGHAQSTGVMLMGTIRSSSGELMEGVTVSARLPGKTFTISVFTDAAGEYYFPRMEPGKYKVWAQAQGYEAVADVDVTGAVKRHDFSLAPITDPEKRLLQMRGDEWVASLPEESYQDLKMKEVFVLSCGGCHNQNMALKDRFDVKGWKNIITVMSRISTSGYRSTEDANPNPFMDYFKDDLAAYLAKVRGPGSPPLTPQPRARPTGDETLVVIREYDTVQPGTGLPLFDDGSLWSLGAPSKLDIKNFHAIDGTLDFEGNVYFSDDLNRNPYRSVGKIDWKTGKITNFKVPRADGSGMAAAVHDVVTDHDGIVWFGADGRLARIDPRTDTLETFSPPDGRRWGGMTAVDGKGGIWGASRPGALRFDPETKSFAYHENPITKSKLGSASTYGMAGDRDGNGWLSQYAIDIMVKHDSTTGESENVQIPKRNNPRYELFTAEDRRFFELIGGSLFQGRGLPNQHGIRKPGAGPGPTDAVWGPGWLGEALLKIDLRTHRVTEYPYPWPYGGSYQAAIDKDGMVFVIFTNGDYVGKFDPKTERWTRYDLPTVGTEAHGLQLATVNGRTQVTAPYFAAGKTAKLEFRTRGELQTLKAEAQRLASVR